MVCTWVVATGRQEVGFTCINYLLIYMGFVNLLQCSKSFISISNQNEKCGVPNFLDWIVHQTSDKIKAEAIKSGRRKGYCSVTIRSKFKQNTTSLNSMLRIKFFEENSTSSILVANTGDHFAITEIECQKKLVQEIGKNLKTQPYHDYSEQSQSLRQNQDNAHQPHKIKSKMDFFLPELGASSRNALKDR